MSTNSNSYDALARLLAKENISIVRGNVNTASFNIVSRLLVLPTWKDMTLDEEEMLILHEVGHALFTEPEKYIKANESESPVFIHYMNVIEDIRIEKKMKILYPGSRKCFIRGYQKLIEKDFFGINSTNTDNLNFIDRINLYFKLGYSSRVKFNKEEFEFVLKLETLDTIEDVISIAKEIFKYSKTQLEQSNFESKYGHNDLLFDEDLEEEKDDYLDDYDDELQNGSFDYEEAEDELDTNYEEAEDKLDTYLKNGPEDSYEEYQASNLEKDNYRDDYRLQSITDKNLKSNLEKVADESFMTKYYSVDFRISLPFDKIFIPYQQVYNKVNAFSEAFADRNISLRIANDFKNKNNGMIASMAKQFEMKKSAVRWKYAKTSKIGQINQNKLYAFKLKDDIFKQITKLNDSKNHGMIFLIDWSGSMQEYIKETIEQLINLTSFCKRTQIEFQVLAFTSETFHDIERTSLKETCTTGLGNASDFSLLELLSSKMTEREYNNAVGRLLDTHYFVSCYKLGGTPLNQALLTLADYAKVFKQNNQIEKLSVVVLTDGESNCLEHISERAYDSKIGKIVKYSNYIKDQVTKKDYPINSDNDSMTNALVQILRDRYDCSVIGFCILANSRREIHRFIRSNLQFTTIDLFDAIRIALRQDGYMNSKIGKYNQFFLMNSAKMQVENDIDLSKINSDMSSSQIAINLKRTFTKNKNSRIVLNKFVDTIS